MRISFVHKLFGTVPLKCLGGHNFYGNDKTNDDVGDDDNHGEEDW